MLEIKDLNVFYGAIHALKGISLTVGDGELVSLIGANGAGKTTTLHTISGLLHAASGSITLDGKDLQKVPANTIINLGLAHVPEGRHVFARMTVEENLRMGAYIIKDQKKMIPCSAALEGEYGMKDITIGVPCIIGKNGIEKILELNISEEERAKLRESEAAVRKTTAILKDLNVL